MFRDADEAERRQRVPVFEAVNAGGHGHLTLHEFQRAMAIIGSDLARWEPRVILHLLDRDEDGVIGIHDLPEAVGKAEDVAMRSRRASMTTCSGRSKKGPSWPRPCERRWSASQRTL